jgi:hypothetical protein
MAQKKPILSKHINSTRIVVEHRPNRIHFVPIRKTQTWAKGSKHVLVHGMEDKLQVIVLVSSSTSTNLLPFQIIFSRLIERSILLKILDKRCVKKLDGISHI